MTQLSMYQLSRYKEEFNQMENLYDQYAKEYRDLCDKTGIAKTMRNGEIAEAKRRLRTSMFQLAKDISAMADNIKKCETELKNKEAE